MRFGGAEFWKEHREYVTKKDSEEYADFKVTIYKDYEFQTWTNAQGKPVLRVFKGKSGKAVSHYYYGSVEHREETMRGFMKTADSRERHKLERAEARKNMINVFKVGDILYSSWGYDQTNIDFYEVVGVTAKSVKLEKIGGKVSKDEDGGGYTIPLVADTSHRTGKVFMRRVSSYNGEGYVSISSFQSAHKWDGRPLHETHPAFGH